MRVLLLFSLMLILSNTAYSQVITRRGNAEWIKSQNKIYSKSKPVEFKTSKQHIKNEIKNLKEYSDYKENIFGITIDTELDINSNGCWDYTNDSINIWTLGISSAKALFMCLIFKELEIPHNDELFIYNPSKTILMGPFTNRNNVDGGSYATDMIESDQLILEYHQNKNSIVAPKLSISGIVHGINDELLGAANANTKQTNCFIDVNCQEGNGWVDQKNGTCLILKLGNPTNPQTSGTLWASGALINNTANDNTPYILTAWHNTQGTGSDISLWIFRFKYWNTTCNGTVNSETISYCGGSVLEEWKNDGVNNDVALVKMYETPTYSDNVYYCGWNVSSNTPSSSTLLSHPQDGNHLMKIAKSNSVSSDGLWWKSFWYIGGATHGSSGGPLFDENKRIAGVHHGRYDNNCDAAGKAGKLSFSWNNNGVHGHKISYWLNPNNLNITQWDGRYRCEETLINFMNYTNNSFYINGCVVIIKNTTVQNTANIIIDAENEVLIERDFEVKLGATMIIN